FGVLGATSAVVPSKRIQRWGFPPAELGEAAAPTKGQMTPVLERRLGAWDQSLTIKPLLGKESKITATETVTRAFGGTFIQIVSVSEDGGEIIDFATYHPAR